MTSITVSIKLSLLIISFLLYITISSCAVYTITPDDHNTTVCHHCYNLQHYLLNVTKYFTSNTQLLFLPGLHHLHTDLIIQNVHNISLIGSAANGTAPATVIQLWSNLSTLLIMNTSMLSLKSITINITSSYLLESQHTLSWEPLTIKDCSFVLLQQIQVHQQGQHDIELALIAINIMGISYFNHVVGFDEMHMLYNETRTDRKNHSLSIDNCIIKALVMEMFQTSYRVTLRIISMRVQNNEYYDYYKAFIYGKELGTSEVLISDCQFISNIYRNQLISFSSTSNGSVQFNDCSFENNKPSINMEIKIGDYIQNNLIKLYKQVNLEFNNCNFHGNNDQIIVQTDGRTANPANVVIRNTNYTTTMSRSHTIVDRTRLRLISISHATLVLIDSVIFHDITSYENIISLEGNSTMIISGTVMFSFNDVEILINLYKSNKQYVIIIENITLYISHNKVKSLFDTNLPTAKYPYPTCFFQYYTRMKNKVSMEERNFQITFYNNQCYKNGCYGKITITNCHWLAKSLFNNINDFPLEVNNHYISFINNSGSYKLSQIIEQSSLCVCTNELHYNCHIFDLGYLYPGVTLTLSLHCTKADTANAVVVKTDIDRQYITPCIVLNISENLQLIDKRCTRLQYTIGFPTVNNCELFLKIASDTDDYLSTFYIRQITCPIGFVKVEKRCQCDPVLVQYGITNCNINDQTILRPANSWISATTHNNSYTNHISLHCPFHYCLPHSSHLNLPTPNPQCQFNRYGLLCGHCLQGLSTIFSTPHCQHCSSIYLLLIIPIAIAGLVLVSLLFVLNLTVTDGTINGFILYVNIISINTPVFFTELNHLTPTYIFISLANLDLGVQTCFYNGMDDYAKMWLQLVFPFYLIFIATLIIITSHYSTTIQRLTTRRALPVLATLFLLSYTKILIYVLCPVSCSSTPQSLTYPVNTQH